jgi:molybdate transport system ATP-binding protein
MDEPRPACCVGVPMVYVSHAMEEVVRLAACVVIIEAGRVKSIGAPDEAFGVMGSRTARSRFDRSSVLAATVVREEPALGLTELKHPSETVWVAGPVGPAGSTARVIVKATDVVVSLGPPRELSARSALSGTIAGIQVEEPLATIEIALDGDGHVFAAMTRGALEELDLKFGRRVFALFKTSALDEQQIATASTAS